MMRFRCLAALVLVLAASRPATGEEATGKELWRAAQAAGECRLILVNELGGVGIGTSSAENPAAVIHGASALVIENSAGAEQPVLSVAWGGDSPADPAVAGVELSVPPGCEVAVRTTDGAVSLEVGRQALPVAIETVTGAITVSLHADADATIMLATSGEITTDFTIEIDFRYHEEAAKYGLLSIGSTATDDIATDDIATDDIATDDIATDDTATDDTATIRLTSRRGAVSVLRATREQSRSR